jgi:hypothetical protein
MPASAPENAKGTSRRAQHVPTRYVITIERAKLRCIDGVLVRLGCRDLDAWCRYVMRTLLGTTWRRPT